MDQIIKNSSSGDRKMLKYMVVKMFSFYKESLLCILARPELEIWVENFRNIKL